MRALWLEEGDLQFVTDLPQPRPADGEALLRVIRAGICNTDLELVKGYYPFTGVPGHEFVAQVAQAPGYDGWVGKRVVGEINVACGVCRACTGGRRTHCERRTVLGIKDRNGAFADYCVLPVANLHEVPDAISDDVAVFAEPTAAALQIREQVPIDRDHVVVIIGDGKLGNLVAQTIVLTDCDLLVIGRHEEKLALLAERGIRTGQAEDLPGGAADIAIECTGNAEGFDLARRAVRPCGTVVLKSTYEGMARVDLSRLVVDEITVVGSRCGPFRSALEHLRAGSIDVRPLIETTYPVEQGVEAFHHAARRGARKVLIRP